MPQVILFVLVCIGLTLAGMLYFAAPLLIYLTHRQAANPQLVPFTLGADPMPPDVDAFYRHAIDRLAPEGFESLGGIFMPSQVEGVMAGLIMLANRKDQVAAIAVAIYPVIEGSIQKPQLHVEFVSRYSSGGTLQTNNADALSSLPTRPTTVTIRMPSIRDPLQLYRIHQAMEIREMLGGRKIFRLDDEFAGNAIAYLTFAIREELEMATEFGYMWYEPQSASFRPTLKGAYLMTWAELWPFKKIRRARRAAKEKQILSELEAGGKMVG